MREQALQFGAEHELAVRQKRVEERLHAEAVAREEERLSVPVPEREGEHPAEPLDALLAPLLPGVDDDFRIALRAEHVAARGELRDELLVVVDLAVEDDDDAAVLVVERLLAGGEVDDGEPAVAETEARLDVHPAFVRAAVVLGLVHAVEQRAIDPALAASVEDADDAAHGALAPSR